MIKVLAFSAVACAISGFGHLRRAKEISPIKSYEFDPTQAVGIIPHSLTSSMYKKAGVRVAEKITFLDGAGEGPETLEAVTVPLLALTDGAISVYGRKFKLCSDAELFKLPSFDISSVVVNGSDEVVGYFEKTEHLPDPTP